MHMNKHMKRLILMLATLLALALLPLVAIA